MAGQYMTASGVLGSAFGLVPMLWEDNGWSGALNRAGAALPLAMLAVLGVNAWQAWKERRARRAAAKAGKITAPSELEGE